MIKGTVKCYNADKGFGFIKHDNGKDIIFYSSAILGPEILTLKEGELVCFETNEDTKGLKATYVIKL